ncbi:MAG: hypothetical protein K0R10_2115 [Alphaproteobacteria bacterium]|jgi:hypothetical protein|nr:hypothetical protein [Alphaproteobacteria bacterium]
MKRFFITIAALLLVIIVAIGIFVGTTIQRLQEKGAKVESGLQQWAKDKRDITEPYALAQQVKPALDAGELKQAETLLDNALSILNEPAAPKAVLPKHGDSDLYGNAQAITIDGYDGQAMEPALSADGQTLFFNNEKEASAQTDLHFATRTGDLTFKYAGKLSGGNGDKLDAIPSIDESGRFYFTSLRSYAENLQSLYTGKFNGRELLDLRAVRGDITPKTPGEINMDASVSVDGRQMYIARARFERGSVVPKESDLMLANIDGYGNFRIAPDSFAQLINVNSDALEYAPAISADGLELYFTRAIEGDVPHIMVATRSNTSRPFDAPKALVALEGFTEAPATPKDGQEMFFHKKEGGKYSLLRVVRKK